MLSIRKTFESCNFRWPENSPRGSISVESFELTGEEADIYIFLKTVSTACQIVFTVVSLSLNLMSQSVANV
jgi:hypothetical protein